MIKNKTELPMIHFHTFKRQHRVLVLYLSKVIVICKIYNINYLRTKCPARTKGCIATLHYFQNSTFVTNIKNNPKLTYIYKIVLSF